MSALAQNLKALSPTVQEPLIQRTESDRALRRANRSAAAARVWRLAALGATAWVLLMGMAFAFVWVNTASLAEARAITMARQELVALDKQNQELEGQLVRAASVGEIERWALAHGMKRPTNVKALRGSSAAVADRQAGLAQPIDAHGEAGLWGTVRTYLSRLGSAVNLTGKSR